MLFLQGPKATISALAFSPDGELLALGGSAGSIDLLDVNGELTHLAPDVVNGSTVSGLVFSDDSSRLYQVGNTQCRDYYDFGEKHWQSLGFSEQPITALAELGEGVLAIGTGQSFRLWDTKRKTSLVPQFREPSVKTIAVHRDSRTVAWGGSGSNRILKFWQTTKLEAQQIMLKQSSNSLSFHPEGELIASAFDWQISIFSLATQIEKLNLKGHTGRVSHVSYHPSGRFLATSSWDKTVRFWDTTGEMLSTFDWQIGRIHALAFAPDGLRIAAGGEEGKIAIWDVE